MMKTIRKKLNSSKGETISEVLIAGLVVVLAFVMVMSLINTSYHVLTKTDEKMDEYYAERNAFETGSDASASGKVSISSTGSGNAAQIVGDQIDVTVTTTTSDDGTKYIYYENKKAGS